MHKFVADTFKNRFFMQMKGYYTAEKMSIAANESILEAKKLKPGYTIINDSADLHIHDRDGVAYLGKMMEFAKTYGAKTVIRLVDDKLSQTQLKDQTKRVNPNLNIVECSSVDEIEEYLKRFNL